MKTRSRILLALCSCLILASTIMWGQFTAGNLSVLRVGDGTAALSASGTPVFIDEYTAIGNSVQSIPFDTVAFTNSGSSTSEGQILRSVDGRYLTCGGYYHGKGVAVATFTAAVINRAVARIDASGTIDVSTKLTDAYNGSNIRSVLSTDGTAFYTSGNGGSGQGATAGVRYIGSLGATTSTALQTTNSNTRVVGIFNNQLYYSTASSPNFGVVALGTGVPTSGTNTPVLLNGFPTATGPSSYGFAKSADGNTIYVADDRAKTAGGGLQKWTLSGGTWSLAYTDTMGLAAGLRSLTVDWTGTNPVIYAVDASSPSNLVKVTDTGVSSVFSTLAIAAANTAWRGVSFTPNATISLTDGSTYTAPNVALGPNDNPIGRFQLKGNINGSKISQVVVSLSGNYSGITNLKLYYSNSATFSTSNLLATVASPTSTVTFVLSNSQAITITDGYFFVAADLSGAATGSVMASITDQTMLSVSNASTTNFSNASLSSSNVSITANFGATITSNGTGGGSWNSASTWSGGVIPKGADSVIIAGTDLVIIPAIVPDTCGSLVIQSGGTLRVDTGFVVRTGTLTVNGTLLDTLNGTISAAGTISFGNGSLYRHARAGGNIPLATWGTGSTCLITGTTSVSPGNAIQNFYNFTWNCPGMSSNLNLAWDNIVIGGNVTCLSTGSGPSQFRLSSAATLRTITINGNVIVQGGILTVSGSSGAAQYNTTVKGDIIFSQKGRMNLCGGSGGFGTWYIEGNVSFADSSVFLAPSNKTVNTILIFSKLNGLQTFTYSSAVANANLNYGVANNSTVTLNSPITVGSSSTAGFLVLTSGKFITTSTNVITLAASGSIVTGAGYVSGPLAATVASASAKSMTFALGKSKYRPVVLNLTQDASTSTVYTAEVFDSAPPTYTLPGTIDAVSSVRYYHIGKGAGANISTATLQLSYDSTEGVNVFNKDNVRVAKDNGSGKWISLGGSGSADTMGTITSGNAIGQTSGYGTLTTNDFVVAHANPSFVPSAPVLSTNPSTFVSTTTATSGGVISSDGDAAVTAKGVCWSINPNPTIADSLTNDGATSTPFTSKMTNLIAGTKYYVRAYATNSSGTAYGNQDTLVTLSAIAAPTVVTNAVTDIVNTTATGNGDVTLWGGVAVTDRGICWSLSHNPTLAAEFNSAGAGTGGEGAFTAPIGGLVLGSTYYVRAYAINSIDTAYGAEVTLTTPTPQADVTKIVDKNGIVGVNCDYNTITAAFADVPDNYTGHWYIYVRKGTYYEKPLLAAAKINVVLVGEDKNTTIITYDDYAGNNRTTNGVLSNGTNTSYTCAIDAADFQAQNITFQNTANAYAPGSSASQAVALRTNGDRQAYYNCNMLGYQDTYYTQGGLTGPDRIYNKNCYVEGSVDFIFGRDVALFDSSTIYCNRSGGVLTAAATEVGYTFGYVFLNCTLGSPAAGDTGVDKKPMTTFFLGRPWQQSPKTVYINCYEPATVDPAGWTVMGPNPSLYSEHGCTGRGALASRPVNSTWVGAKQPSSITDSAAATYTIANIFSKNNKGSGFSYAANWTPAMISVVFPVPTLESSVSAINFGTVTVPASKRDSVIVTNSGNADLKVIQVNSTDAHFTISPLTATIAPSGTQKFYITFIPDSTKTYNVKIIFSNNSLKGADTISIIGQGIKNPTGVENRLAGIPDMYILRENYPNPFNPSTTIEYGLPHKSIVSMKVYSVLGQEVATLISQEQAAGYHQTIWNASNISSGIYFMRINAQSVEGKAEIFTQVKKMLLMK